MKNNAFERKFMSILKESADEEAAFADTLSDEVSPEDFGADYSESGDDHVRSKEMYARAAEMQAQHAANMVKEVEDWIIRFDEFLEFLNGTGPDSIQTVLSNAEADTILDQMRQSEQRKISRVATELAALTESFKGYIAQSSNSKFKYV